MKITYDSKADAIYIYLREGDVCQTEELEPGVMRDLGRDGEVIGVEVLSARKRMDKLSTGWTVSVPTAKAG